ncbi:hypothetical protein [Bosea sp. (in: a-proteobacteria)]|jgi:putative intracellular protease/amidase|uniref:hypothetical protein n=1 Tax=Bosea sp. (in: a-proteobacteria) TaxID=1871050 RepID=UPI002DDD27B4|nr:hypothetical protein [Bosea sp. (in: a-proteobacteria)]HEV2512627.1 hypothetical protein [Bosea sp. (in: a-proteobacteria)]
MTAQAKRRALIILSSARQLPLSEPASVPSISTGFFLVELAQVLAEFESDYEFTLATPDGEAPQLDINGMGLSFHAIDKLGSAMMSSLSAFSSPAFTPESYRKDHPEWVARRKSELALMQRHIGRVSVSEALPATDPEATAFRQDLLREMEAWPVKTFLSLEDLIRCHRDPGDRFSLADFDFIHAPGGHAPMVDFRNDPWLGETLHVARESEVLISLICHAPIAMTSTSQRIDAQGKPVPVTDNPFAGVDITTVPEHGEMAMLESGYPSVPGKRTRLAYFVDVALEDAGFSVKTSQNPFAVIVVQSPQVGLISGNGPQAIDMQALAIRLALADRSVSPPGVKRTEALSPRRS